MTLPLRSKNVGVPPVVSDRVDHRSSSELSFFIQTTVQVTVYRRRIELVVVCKSLSSQTAWKSGEIPLPLGDGRRIELLNSRGVRCYTSGRIRSRTRPPGQTMVIGRLFSTHPLILILRNSIIKQ